jgi:hypothetical protein
VFATSALSNVASPGTLRWGRSALDEELTSVAAALSPRSKQIVTHGP